MSDSPNKLIRFWQELKRRKVFKVIAMYAGTAFIILQLFDIIAQPLQLPAWTMTFVIILLCIGFTITLLVAWVYDITPEGIKKTGSIEAVKSRKSQALPLKRRIKANDIIIVGMAIVIVILVYPKVFNKDKFKDIKDPDGRISIAVMPFQNMTNDSSYNIWQDVIQNELINNLTNSKDLKVRQIESINYLIQSKGITYYTSITPSLANKISQTLDANVFINGTLNKIGSTLRINAQLIDSKTEEVFKSFKIEGIIEIINFNIIDSISIMIKNYLIISELGKEVIPDFHPFVTTNSPEAYKFFISGNNAYWRRDWSTAINMYLQAVAIDSNFTLAIIQLSISYGNQGSSEGSKNLFDQAKEWCLRAYEKRDQMPQQLRILANWAYAINFETPFEVIKYDKQLLEFDDHLPRFYYNIGDNYNLLYQYDKAIPVLEKALEIYDKWKIKPMWAPNYFQLGIAYHETGQYEKEKELYKKAEQDFPNDLIIAQRQAILALTEGDSASANHYIEKYISIRQENPATEAMIANALAGIYLRANILDKAEEYYRKALSLEPERTNRVNNLAWFLIDNNRNVTEGLQLVEKALKLSPDNHYYLDCKSWGLYKEGRYQKALDILQKSWELRPSYRHAVYLHLEAVKKAAAGQNQVK